MKKLWLATAILALASFSLACDAKKSDSAASNSATAEKEVRAASEAYDIAMKEQNAEALEKVYVAGAKVIEASGKELSSSDVVATAKAGETKYEEGRSEEVSVQVHGDTAVVRGTWVQKGTMKGQAFAGKQRYATVYVKHDGKWLVMSDQVTDIK